jgi:hypothetical protein
MRFAAALSVLIFSTVALAQDSTKLAPRVEPKSVTVPFKLDHDRIIVDVEIPLSDGTTQRVPAWVDNGNPDLHMSRRLASLTGGSIACEGKLCSATAPVEMNIGGMTIPLRERIPGAGIKTAWVSAADNGPLAPGLSAEINIPSSVLRRYDVLINFPDREFTIAQPGTLKFKGVKANVMVNGGNGVIQVPSQIENKKYNLALDLGSSISSLSAEMFDKLASAHPDWPHMTGAVGPANLWGENDEVTRKLMRVERVQFGPLYLTNVAVANDHGSVTSLARNTGNASAGSLGSEALLNYRVGLDYAHSSVYFDIGRLFNSPDFNVIGLILRPEDDGRFTILGVADFDGKPSVPLGQDGVQAGDHLVAVDGIRVQGSTMGQVLEMLRGLPGKDRRLAAECGGRQFTVVAKVQQFLGETDEDDRSGGKSHKN